MKTDGAILGQPMTILEKLLRHDAWTTRLLLTRAAGLSDAALDQPFDMGHRTLRKTFRHIIANMECWCDLVLARPQRSITQTPDDDIPALMARLDIVAAELVAFGESFSSRGRNDDIFTDYLDNPPQKKSVSTALVHLATHGMHHRAQCLWMMRHLGLKNLPEGDVFSWENACVTNQATTAALTPGQSE
jgi:uncharacterized damage-inducible protein DinB